MKLNYETGLVGSSTILVPYRRDHVLNYHTWMLDTALLEATASEPLSLPAEYDMQQSWREDPDKCTFIVLEKQAVDVTLLPKDGNNNYNVSSDDFVQRTLSAMVGDVNLFLSDEEKDYVSDSDENNIDGPAKVERSDNASTPQRQAELDIMIANGDYRGKGLGKDAACLMMLYGASHLNIRRFFCKIQEDNVASLALFGKLGFEQCSYAECFREIELELKRESAHDMVETLSTLVGSSTLRSFHCYASSESKNGNKVKSIHVDMREQLTSKELFEQAKEYAFQYIDTVNDRPVFPTDQALANLAVFNEPLPESPQDGAAILKLLHEYGAPATTAITGGRYFGFVNGNVTPTASAARWMAGVWDQNAALYVMSPIAAMLEQVTEKWCADLLGLFPDTAMGLVGGTSIANLCGLAAGRHLILQKQGWDVEADGLFGSPPIRVIVSEQSHSSVGKGLALLGLGNKRVERVPVDDQGRILVEKLPQLDATCILILQAGHVSSGSFDPFDEICDLAHKAGAWVHIDGAFGLWAAASKKLCHLTRGLEKADSWAVDGHKTLNTPYDCGIVLCKHRAILNAAMAATGSYIQPKLDNRDGMFYSPDMSRRARSIELWATLKYLGRNGVEQLMNEMVARAQEFGEQLSAAGFKIQNEIVFNQCLVKCDSPEETTATLANVQKSETMWCGGAAWMGEPAIRISVCSWATTVEDVRMSVAALVQARGASRDGMRVATH